MIDKEKFAAGLGILANNFNKTVDAALSRVWYRTLSAQLTTEEFEQAVLHSIETDTFWPTAASLVQKVKPSIESDGLAALEHVGRITSKHGGFRFLPHDVFKSEFDEPTRAAISAVGGLMQIAQTTDERWAGLQKRFSAAYANAKRGTPALPSVKSAQLDDRVASLTSGVVRKLSLVSGKDRAAGIEP